MAQKFVNILKIFFYFLNPSGTLPWVVTFNPKPAEIALDKNKCSKAFKETIPHSMSKTKNSTHFGNYYFSLSQNVTY
jgi:hypothetical protein